MRLPFGAQWAARATIFGHNQSINGPTWGAANWSSLPDLLSCQICQNAGGKIRHKTQRQIRLIKKQKHFVKIAQNAISFFEQVSILICSFYGERHSKLTTSAICFMRLFVYIIFSSFFSITDIHTQSIVCQILCLYCLAKNTNWKATKSAPQSLAKNRIQLKPDRKWSMYSYAAFFLGSQRKNNKTQRNIDSYGCVRLADVL